MKIELENTLMDITIYEISMFSNFLNPFEGIRPQVHFFTTDKNLYYYYYYYYYYYSKLGKPLVIIGPDDSFQRLYYPDLSLLNLSNKEKIVLKKYFKRNTVDELKTYLIESLGISENKILGVDLQKVSYFNNQLN